MNSAAGVNACCMKEYSIAIHAHPTLSRLLSAHGEYWLYNNMA
jgi:hypothetical protein